MFKIPRTRAKTTETRKEPAPSPEQEERGSFLCEGGGGSLTMGTQGRDLKVLLFHCGRQLIATHIFSLSWNWTAPHFAQKALMMMWYSKRLVLLFILQQTKPSIELNLLGKCFLFIFKTLNLSHSSIYDMSVSFKRMDVHARHGAAWFPLQLRKMQHPL